MVKLSHLKTSQKTHMVEFAKYVCKNDNYGVFANGFAK